MTLDEAQPNVITVGVIAEMLKVPCHRISYVLRTRRDIQPIARLGGHTRIFDREAVTLIRNELLEIAASKANRRSR